MQSPAFPICANLLGLQLHRLSYKYPALGQGQSSVTSQMGTDVLQGWDPGRGQGKLKLRETPRDFPHPTPPPGGFKEQLSRGWNSFFLPGDFFFLPHIFVCYHDCSQWFTSVMSKSHSGSSFCSWKHISKAKRVMRGPFHPQSIIITQSLQNSCPICCFLFIEL